MKLKLTVIACCVASALPAMAQSVEMYGSVDVGVSRVSGLPKGLKNFVVSGIMDGSRLGFRGKENLGGGYQAVFTLENRLEVDTGAGSVRPPSASLLPDRLTNAVSLGLPAEYQRAVSGAAAGLGAQVGVNVNNTFFDRQAFVGLITPYGAFLGGRQYTPAYEVLGTFDTLGTQSSLSSGQVASLPAAIDIRVSNSLAYRIAQGGFSASLMVAAGEGSAVTGRFGGIGAMYKTDTFALGGGYNVRENEAGKKSLSTMVLGASVKVGPGHFFLSAAQAKDDNPSGLSSLATGLVAAGTPAAVASQVQTAFFNGFKQDGRQLHLGYKPVMGAHTLYLAATAYDDRRPQNADVMSYGAAYSYAFSKRTDANVVVTHFDNKTNAQAAP
jgi:predicted porin